MYVRVTGLLPPPQNVPRNPLKLDLYPQTRLLVPSTPFVSLFPSYQLRWSFFVLERNLPPRIIIKRESFCFVHILSQDPQEPSDYPYWHKFPREDRTGDGPEPGVYVGTGGSITDHPVFYDFTEDGTCQTVETGAMFPRCLTQFFPIFGTYYLRFTFGVVPGTPSLKFEEDGR